MEKERIIEIIEKKFLKAYENAKYLLEWKKNSYNEVKKDIEKYYEMGHEYAELLALIEGKEFNEELIYLVKRYDLDKKIIWG